MRRVAVIGSPGSGKTSVGAAIAAALDAPFVELDALHHRPDWEQASVAEFRAAVAERLDGPRWVADGNHRQVADITQGGADTIVWLDLPRWFVTWRVLRRSVRRIVTHERLWHGNRETLGTVLSRDPARNIVVWTWQQHPRYQARYEAQLAERIWSHATVVRLRTRREIRAFTELAAMPSTSGVSG